MQLSRVAELGGSRDDDPQYIVRLVGQVVERSMDTVKIVNALPADFEPK